MKQKIQEAKEAVRCAYSLRPAQWKKLLKSDWVCEYGDTQTFGARSVPGAHTLNQGVASKWARKSSAIEAAAPAFTFPDAKHNMDDPLQAHYELAWGSPEGCDLCKIEADDMIQCCETILTRIRCWVEAIPLKD